MITAKEARETWQAAQRAEELALVPAIEAEVDAAVRSAAGRGERRTRVRLSGVGTDSPQCWGRAEAAMRILRRAGFSVRQSEYGVDSFDLDWGPNP